MKAYLKMLAVFLGLIIACGCETDSLFRAHRFFQRRQYDKAEWWFTYYLDKSEDREDNMEYRAAGYCWRGLARSALSKHEASISDYREALSRVPDCFYASFNLGVELLMSKRYGEAVDYFRCAWAGVQKAHKGELDDSKLWDRNTLDRDSEFCFQYLGMLLLKTRNIDGIKALLDDSKKLPLKMNRQSTKEAYRKMEKAVGGGLDGFDVDCDFQKWESARIGLRR
jgi:tetratricopeptide (TPR) repeat protein